jgi:hypothetical protein
MQFAGATSIAPVSSMPTPRFRKMWQWETVGERSKPRRLHGAPLRGQPVHRWFASSPPRSADRRGTAPSVPARRAVSLPTTRKPPIEHVSRQRARPPDATSRRRAFSQSERTAQPWRNRSHTRESHLGRVHLTARPFTHRTLVALFCYRVFRFSPAPGRWATIRPAPSS